MHLQIIKNIAFKSVLVNINYFWYYMRYFIY